MKKLIATLLLVGLTGCFGGVGSKQAEKALAKVEAAESKIAAVDAQRDAMGRVYIRGADAALRRQTERTPAIEAAASLVSRAGLIYGAPGTADALQVERVVDGLVSADQTALEAARRDLAAMDARVAGLEQQLRAAEKGLAKAEDNRDGVMRTASAFADKYLRIRNLVIWAVIVLAGIVVLPAVLRIAALFAGGPLGGLLASTAGWYARSVTSAVPGALAKAGAVASDQFNRVSDTLASVVVGVERAKKQDPRIKEALKAILLAETDRAQRPVIEDVLAHHKDRI